MYLVNRAVRAGKEFEHFSFTRDKICYFVQMSKVIHRWLLTDNFDMVPIFEVSILIVMKHFYAPWLTQNTPKTNIT